MGVSIENKANISRAEDLKQTGAQIKFISGIMPFVSLRNATFMKN